MIDHIKLAESFHDTYENLAPQYGYETRGDTKRFNPESPNGKLMIEVIRVHTNAILEHAAVKCEQEGGDNPETLACAEAIRQEKV